MLTHVRRRQLLVAALAGAVSAALGVTLTTSHAAPTASDPTELLTSAKTLASLKAGVTYQASTFPLPLRLTAPLFSLSRAPFLPTIQTAGRR